MQPRILFRTHYQVDEPDYVGMIVRACCSAVAVRYKEAVAEKLVRAVMRRGNDARPLNLPAAGYAVDLARALGVINDQCTWTDKGMMLWLLTENKPQEDEKAFGLDARAKLVYFRLFLDADGAALGFLGQRAMEHGRLPYESCNWNSLAHDMFIEVFSDYLGLTADTAERVELRNRISRLETKEYKGKTGSHKMFIHLQSMHRLGLLERREDDKDRQYSLPPVQDSGESAVAYLMSEIGDLSALEGVIRNHRWLSIGAKVLGYSHRPYRADKDASARAQLSAATAATYAKIMTTGIPLCALSALGETVRIEMLVRHGVLLAFEDVVDYLEALRRQVPRSVRFHVDRQGKPAYVRLADTAIEALLDEGSED